MPAPISLKAAACSITCEAMPWRASASAAVNPPRPPPTMRTCSFFQEVMASLSSRTYPFRGGSAPLLPSPACGGEGKIPRTMARRSSCELEVLAYAERLKDALRRDRHLRDRRRAERTERIVDRVHHAARRAGGAGLAGAFGAKLGIRGRRYHMADVHVRHFGGHRHQVIHQIGVEHLAFGVIEAVLEQNSADALDDAAADLLVDELRIDDGPAILDTPVLEQAHLARSDIDFEV